MADRPLAAPRVARAQPAPSTRVCLERLARDPSARAIAGGLALLLERTAGEPSVRELDAILGPLAGVRFEPQAPARSRRSTRVLDVASRYDGMIATRGVVPSREGSLHDILNALVWASLPATKRAIHARQYAVMRAHVPSDATRMPNARPREADVLAMLDEGGLVFAVRTPEARAALERALVTGEADAVAASARTLAIEVQVLGHAVLEHLAEAREGDPRAAAYVVVVEREAPAGGDVDAALARGPIDRALALRVAEHGAMLAPPPWPAVPVRALFERLAAHAARPA